MPLDDNYRLIPPGEAGAQPSAERPIVGALIAAYGCYINPADITKIEPVAVGVNHHVMVHLRGGPNTGEPSQRSTAFLTPPLDTEREAQQVCDAIASSMFLVLSTNPETGGAHWPTPPPPVTERFGVGG